MKLFKKLPLDITATFLFPQTTRNNYFSFSYLLDIKEMTCNLLQETVANKTKRWRPLLKNFLLHLQEKLNAGNDQTQQTDSYLQKQQANTTPEITNDQDPALVIKTNAADHPAHDKIQLSQFQSKNALAGLSILCVGGRAALYPEYSHLITSLGARLLIYRGSLKNNMNHLYAHLEKADMVICPIDCVNHNDFFAVKFYCKISGKPYTLLDRSNLATFNAGVKTLSRLARQRAYLPNGYTHQAASILQN